MRVESTVGPERARISKLVKFAGVDPELIFTGRFASDAAPQGAPQQQQAPPQAQGLPQVAQQPQQVQAQPQPELDALAQAFTGALPEAAQAGLAPPMATQAPQGPPPADSLKRQRVQDYGALEPPVLKRQVSQMAAKLAANPKAYSQEEIDAAKIAYDRAFPGR